MSGIKGTKSDSGAAKRKRQKLAEVFAKSQEGSLFKHFARPGCGVTVSNEVNQTSDSESSQTLHSYVHRQRHQHHVAIAMSTF